MNKTLLSSFCLLVTTLLPLSSYAVLIVNDTDKTLNVIATYDLQEFHNEKLSPGGSYQPEPPSGTSGYIQFTAGDSNWYTCKEDRGGSGIQQDYYSQGQRVDIYNITGNVNNCTGDPAAH